MRLGELEGAEAAARVACALRPHAAKPRYRLAQALLARHEHGEAMVTLAELLRRDPAHREARALLETARTARAERTRAERGAYAALFERARSGAAGDLYSASEIIRHEVAERARTAEARAAEEEWRCGVQLLDARALSRLPAECQQKHVDEMNEAI